MKKIISAVVMAIIFALFALELRASSVVISEIMYHPPVGFMPGTTNIVDGDDYEFLELYNADSNSVDLGGAYFTDGISFSFPAGTTLAPGGFIVVVKDSVRFGERYPWAVSAVAGEYGGKLSNGGETITLVDSASNQLYSVTYNDSKVWPQRADGKGTSLQIVDVAGNPDDPANWCDSDLLFGSPGATGTCAKTDVVINEILAHTDPPLEDAIELLNMTTGTVNIAGWRLSDSIHDVTKYSITNDAIAAGDFAVFYEYQFNDTNDLLGTDDTPFALSSFGDEVYLVAPGPTTNQWRLIDRLDFPGTPNGYSYGHYPDGTGTVALLSARSFGMDSPATIEEFRTGSGASNYPPRVGPVVINEIMYHSAYTNDGSLDYIELYNAGTNAVDISNWSISGVGYTNPPGTVINAGAYLVIAENVVALQSAYGVSGVLGDWTGSLDNGGEVLVLRDHDGAEIDRVKYDDKEPWPVAADGYGPALERIDPYADGNDPANWTSTQGGTNWITVSWQQYASSSAGTFKFWMNYPSRCWLDDVAVTWYGNSNINLVANGNFENGTNGWTAIGNHSTSRPEQGQGIGGSNAMCVAGTFNRYIDPDEAVVYVDYGDSVSNMIYSAPVPTVNSQLYNISFKVRRRGIARKLYAEFQGVTKSVYFGLSGTPETVNSIPAERIPFAVIDVDSAAKTTNTLSVMPITAELSSIAPVDDVKICYREVPFGGYEYTDADYNTVTMTNIGGVFYRGDIPGIITNRTLVRYHIAVTLTNGLTVTSPRVDDPNGDFGYWVEDNPPQTNLPNWTIINDSQVTILHPVARRVCAVSPDGQSFVDVILRHRGNVYPYKPETTGVALRFNQGQLYDSWFMKNQAGINFRNRRNKSSTSSRRILNEFIAYNLQGDLGLAPPAERHVTFNSDDYTNSPTVTVELQAPDKGYLKQHGFSKNDYISRAGYKGRNYVDGDTVLDNFSLMEYLLETVGDAEKNTLIRTNLWYESIRYSMALLAVTANGDQNFRWNMFQHRRADNGLWAQYPWDTDMSFFDNEPDPYLAIHLYTLHPYYETPDFPSIWETNSYLLGNVLFYPYNTNTLPYRYRQQMSLWRFYNTILTTNYLYTKIDTVMNKLLPVYNELGIDTDKINHAEAGMKNFIVERRNYLMNTNWFDKNITIWSTNNIYNPSNVVITEIMYNPDSGGEYLELYNTGTQTIDLSWWLLKSGRESYHLPHGTMLGPTSYLAIADSFTGITNSYREWRDPAKLVQRYKNIPIWDSPLTNFLSEKEYSSEIVELPKLTLPGSGATITLFDWCSNVIDTVTYGSSAPWPSGDGVALELYDANMDNNDPANWRSSFRIGTPAEPNTAIYDSDNDALPDLWENKIVTAFPMVNNISQVLPSGDLDGDGLTHEQEFIFGTDPTVADKDAAALFITNSAGHIMVIFPTILVSGSDYDYYKQRFYTLQSVKSLIGSGMWSNEYGFTELPATGSDVVYTNDMLQLHNNFRYKVWLQPDRP